MVNVKRIYFNTYIILFMIMLLLSCSENNFESEEKIAYVDSGLSIISSKLQFSKDIIYYYRVKINSNYDPDDEISVVSYFSNELSDSIVPIHLYDDGYSDDQLRNDLVASNNIWSGGINALSFPKEGSWELNTAIYYNDSILLSQITFESILVKNNTPPEIVSITGITDNDTLESGFDNRNITIEINDPDNDANGYNDNQNVRLEIRNRDNIDKDYEYVRNDPLGLMTVKLDSTTASKLKTNDNYDLTFIATDMYGESDSLKFRGIRIENTAPVISLVEFPDSINTDNSGIFWMKTHINDPQGELFQEDMDSVVVELNSRSYHMYDDGNFLEHGDENEDDGIYSVGFSYDAGTAGSFDFTVLGYDKAGNVSEGFLGNITLYTSKNNNIKTGKMDAQKFNYIDPFNSK